MKEIFEELYFFRIDVQKDKIIFNENNVFLKNFYLISFFYQSVLNFFLSCFDKKIYYDETIFVDTRIQEMHRSSCFIFSVIYMALFFIELSKQKFIYFPKKAEVYNFFFFNNKESIEKELSLNYKLSEKLILTNLKGEKYLKKLFMSYDITFFFYGICIAYLKLRNCEFNFYFIVKIILSIHLYFIQCFGYKLYCFEIIKKNFILYYMNLKLQNEFHNLDEIKKLIVISKKNIFHNNNNFLITRKIYSIGKKLKFFFKNYNEIIIKQKLLKQDFGFSICLLVCASFICFYLTVIVFYRTQNLAMTLIAAVFYPTMFIGYILPVVISNVSQNKQVFFIKKLKCFFLILIFYLSIKN